MELSFTKSFQKQVQNLTQNNHKLSNKILNCIFDFGQKGKKSKYYRKSLKGKHYGYDELQIGGDLRLIVRINEKQNHAVLIQIGTHSQLNF